MSSFNGGFGAVRFPAPSVTTGASLDAGHEALLGLLKQAINSELGVAWAATLASLNTDQFVDGPGTPVCSALPIEATPQQLTQVKAKFPVLCVYREGEPELVWTYGCGQTWKQKWSVDWILGPVTAAHITKLGRFAVSVARVISRAIDLGYHPDFNSGVCQFFGQFAKVDCVGIAGPGVQQSLTEEAGSGYYGITVTLETEEREFEDAIAKEGEIGTPFYVPIGTGSVSETVDEIYTTIKVGNGS